MMMKVEPENNFKLGSWVAVCDRCGFKYHNDKIKKEWTGLRVCSGPGTNDCWEIRHPQDFVRGVKDPQFNEWSRPDQCNNEFPLHTSEGIMITDSDLNVITVGGAGCGLPLAPNYITDSSGDVITDSNNNPISVGSPIRRDVIPEDL